MIALPGSQEIYSFAIAAFKCDVDPLDSRRFTLDIRISEKPLSDDELKALYDALGIAARGEDKK